MFFKRIRVVRGFCVCVYYCSTYYKAVREEEGGKWRTCATRDYEPGLCELVCPSRTSERGGEGYCVKEGGGVSNSLSNKVIMCVCFICVCVLLLLTFFLFQFSTAGAVH